MIATQLTLFLESIYNFVTPSSNFRNNAPIKIQNTDVELLEIWNKLHTTFFPHNQTLGYYKICWSNRHQTNCLASINIQKRIVRVAPAMKLTEARPFLEALIYHEMCHAIIGIKIVAGRRQMHTKEFKQLERQHSEIKLLDSWIKHGGWLTVVKKSKKLRSKVNLIS